MEVSYETVKAVQDSWDQVLMIPSAIQVVGEQLFRNIFAIAPGSWQLFPFAVGYDKLEDDMFQTMKFKGHAKNVVKMLDAAVHLLGPDLDILEDQLKTLGANHIRYGVFPEHYPIVGQALLMTLEAALGDTWKDSIELQEAWTGVYGFVSGNMLEGANDSLLTLQFQINGSKAKISLDEFVTRMVPGQKHLFFVAGSKHDSDTQATIDRLDKAHVTVLRLPTKAIDMVVSNLEKYMGRKLVNVSKEVHTYANGDCLAFLEPVVVEEGPKKKEARRLSPRSVAATLDGGLSEAQAVAFCDWFKATVGSEKVVACTPTCRFASLAARVVRHESDVKKELKAKDCKPALKKHVEINPGHEMIIEIHGMHKQFPLMARLLAEQVYDNCLINAGQVQDSRAMVNRINEICMGWIKTQQMSSVGW